MCDQEDSTASLGRAEVVPVHDSVGPPIPAVPQRTRDSEPVSAFVTGENPFGILDDDPLGSGLVDEAGDLEEEPGPVAVEALPVRGTEGGVSARESGSKDICSGEVGSCDVTDVLLDRRVREAPTEDRSGVLCDLAHEGAAHPGVQAVVESSDAGEQGCECA